MFKNTKEKQVPTANPTDPSAEKKLSPASRVGSERQEDSLVYHLAYRPGMRQTKKLSRVAFFKRTATMLLVLFALGTVLFVWLPRAAYVGTAELAVILVAALIVFGRIILSLLLGLLGFEKAKKNITRSKR